MWFYSIISKRDKWVRSVYFWQIWCENGKFCRILDISKFCIFYPKDQKSFKNVLFKPTLTFKVTFSGQGLIFRPFGPKTESGKYGENWQWFRFSIPFLNIFTSKNTQRWGVWRGAGVPTPLFITFYHSHHVMFWHILCIFRIFSYLF